MNAADLRLKTVEELQEELVDLRREHFSLKLQRATGDLNRHSEYGRVRRDIARIKTIITEKTAEQAREG